MEFVGFDIKRVIFFESMRYVMKSLCDMNEEIYDIQVPNDFREIFPAIGFWTLVLLITVVYI